MPVFVIKSPLALSVHSVVLLVLIQLVILVSLRAKLPKRTLEAGRPKVLPAKQLIESVNGVAMNVVATTVGAEATHATVVANFYC